MTPEQNRQIVVTLRMLRIAHRAYKAKCRTAYKSKAVKAARKAYRRYQAELEGLMK